MFLSSITVLLCVVCFIGKNDASISIETNSTAAVITSEDVNNGWHEKFYKYDQDKNGSICATELQILLFNESIGLVTISQASRYISLLDRDGNFEIEFGKLEKIEPIVDILSERKPLNVEDNDYSFDGKKTIPAIDFLELLYKEFELIYFDSPNEAKEITDLIDRDANGQIEYNEYEEIELMLEASLKLVSLCEIFTVLDINNNGVITADVIADFIELVYSIQVNSQETTKAINNFDENGNKVIEFSEFLKNTGNLSKDEFSILQELAKKLVA
ncbi:squidulin-like [Adelges cooleyi]|uniref:squidulin-like n=1 Tax=Adelges cooleyi TaxID=133065 RepID=UPI00218006A2|nr:squidulin-like [Adelges cooleyi]